MTQLWNVVDRIGPRIEVEESFVDFPFNKMMRGHLISKVNGNLSQFDVSTQSMKAWKTKFSRVFDSYSVTSRLAKIAIVLNMCSDSTKSRILSMGIGERAKKRNSLSQTY